MHMQSILNLPSRRWNSNECPQRATLLVTILLQSLSLEHEKLIVMMGVVFRIRLC